MDKKYQVFISSTYEDLKKARKEVTRALLEIDCIPTGMELFQASDDDQWKLIQRVINECDYYIVIIGKRYGSIHPKTGKSFTQMEYEYALEKQIPILGFIYRNPENIQLSSADRNIRLEEFIKLAEKKVVKYWSDPYELTSMVSSSIYQIVKTHPRKGWVRNNTTAEIISNNLLLKGFYRLTDAVTNLESHILQAELFPAKKTSKHGDNLEQPSEKSRPFNIKPLSSNILHKIEYTSALIMDNICIDAFVEISNIIISSGFVSLYSFFDNLNFKVTLPQIEIFNSINSFINKANLQNTYNIAYSFSKNISGTLLLKIDMNFLDNFYNDVYQKFQFYNISKEKLKKSFLEEVGSIFSGSCITSLSTLVNKDMLYMDLTNIDLLIQEFSIHKTNPVLTVEKSCIWNNREIFKASFILNAESSKNILQFYFPNI